MTAYSVERPVITLRRTPVNAFAVELRAEAVGALRAPAPARMIGRALWQACAQARHLGGRQIRCFVGMIILDIVDACLSEPEADAHKLIDMRIRDAVTSDAGCKAIAQGRLRESSQQGESAIHDT